MFLKNRPHNISFILFCIIFRGAQLSEKCLPGEQGPIFQKSGSSVNFGIVICSKIMDFDLKWVHMARYELIAARALATYLIPGCVGRGVRLGSENSSATAAVGGVWKSGNLEIWDFGNLEIWGPGNPEILRFGDLEIQNFGIQKIKKNEKSQKSNPFCPKCREGLD